LARIRIRGSIRQPGDLYVGLPPPPIVECVVWLPGIADPEQVEFLIDTGATRSIVHPRDADRLWPAFLTHDFDNDPTRSASGGVGGATHTLTRRAVVGFPRDDGRLDRVQLDLLFARPVAPDRSRGIRGNFHLPSLLGRDVLQLYTLTVTAVEVYLEREEAG
jgi:hypothetical protein